MYKPVSQVGKMSRGELWDDIFGKWDSFFDYPSRAINNVRNSLLTDVVEDDKEYRVRVDAPGFERSEIGVSIEGDILTIKGEKKEDREERYIRKERNHSSYSVFQKLISLENEIKGIDTEKVAANLKNGVLEVILPKKSIENKSSKRIEVS